MSASQHPAALELRLELLRAGKTARWLAGEIGVSPVHLSRVVHGRRRSLKIRKELALRFGPRFLELLPAPLRGTGSDVIPAPTRRRVARAR